MLGGRGLRTPAAPGHRLARELAPDLIQQLTEGAPIIREAAARALGKINPPAKEAAAALGQLLTSGAACLRPAERLRSLCCRRKERRQTDCESIDGSSAVAGQ